MANKRVVYQESRSVKVSDIDDFPLGEFAPLCDPSVATSQPEDCVDRSFDCREALILVVPKGWMKPDGFVEVNDYGYHLEGSEDCNYDLSKGSFLMIPSWKA